MSHKHLEAGLAVRVLTSRFLRCLVCVILCAVTNSGFAQTSGKQLNSINPVLPTVPPLAPRPIVGPNQTWSDGAADRKPVASFVDSLKGNDSVIELVVGQARLLTTKVPFATDAGESTIAIADPTVIDFDVLPRSKMIRILGRRVGVYGIINYDIFRRNLQL